MPKAVSKPEGCFGYCRDCDIVHALPSDRALIHSTALMKQLTIHGRIDFDLPIEEADPLLSTAYLYGASRGKMMGILVCEDATGKEVVLRAFSSKYNGVWNVSGWVAPLFDAEAMTAGIREGDIEIHPLTEIIKTLEKGSRSFVLRVAERKTVSHVILSKLQALYAVPNFRNGSRALADAFNRVKGMPTGTGDCCAPKLLSHAARNNLKPVSIAEFFWGKTTVSGDRVEGSFYSSCVDKCQPLLGYMLCGALEREP